MNTKAVKISRDLKSAVNLLRVTSMKPRTPVLKRASCLSFLRGWADRCSHCTRQNTTRVGQSGELFDVGLILSPAL